MEVHIEFDSYNPRRYGMPWCARITEWPLGGRPEMEFGTYIGNDEGGDCIVAAEEGDVIRYGQRDHRGRHTTAFFAVVQGNGEFVDCSPTEALRAFREKEEKKEARND